MQSVLPSLIAYARLLLHESITHRGRGAENTACIAIALFSTLIIWGARNGFVFGFIRHSFFVEGNISEGFSFYWPICALFRWIDSESSSDLCLRRPANINTAITATNRWFRLSAAIGSLPAARWKVPSGAMIVTTLHRTMPRSFGYSRLTVLVDSNAWIDEEKDF